MINIEDLSMKLSNKEIMMCKIAESIGFVMGLKNVFKENFGESSKISEIMDGQISNLSEVLEYIKKG